MQPAQAPRLFYDLDVHLDRASGSAVPRRQRRARAVALARSPSRHFMIYKRRGLQDDPAERIPI